MSHGSQTTGTEVTDFLNEKNLSDCFNLRQISEWCQLKTDIRLDRLTVFFIFHQNDNWKFYTCNDFDKDTHVQET